MKLVTRFLSSLLLAGLLIGPASAQLVGTGLLPKNILDNPRFDIYQRGVAAATISSSATGKYHADRWAVFTGGSSQALTATNITSSLPTGFLNAEQIKRTSGSNTQTINLAQLVAQSDMAALQGTAVSLSCWMQAGSGLAVGDATANTVSVGITTGTTADEGLATFISGWTGAATPLATTQAITTSWARYGFGPVTIASGANELAVSIGYTPTGSQQTNEFVNVTGCQLEQAPQVTAFENRPFQMELARVQRFFYQITEGSTITPRGVGHITTAGAGDGNGKLQVAFQFPVPMRIAPTATYTAGFAGFTTTAETTRTNCSALVIDPTVTFVNSTLFGLAQCSLTSSTIAVGLSMSLVDNSGSGVAAFSSDL